MYSKRKAYISWFIIILANLSGFTQTIPNNDLYIYNNLNFRKASLFKQVVDFENIDFPRINALLFYLTNEVRIGNKLKPLDHASELERTAMMHAQDMVDDDFFSHINPRQQTKRSPDDRARLCNISNPFLAENLIEGFGLQYKSHEPVYIIDKGQFSKKPDGEPIKPHTYLSFAESLIIGWMNSKDHRKNILSTEALQLGCGTAFFINSDFNDMPSFMAVQNFQFYQKIVPTKP